MTKASELVVRCTAAQADLGDLHALLRGDLRALVLASYVSRAVCASVAAGFERSGGFPGSPRNSLYDAYATERYGLPAAMFGPTLDEHRLDGVLSDRYWERAADAALVDDAVAEVRDLRDCCRGQLAGVFATSVAPATTADGRELYWGLVREIGDGTPVHRHDVAAEFPRGVLDDLVVGQLAFDLFLNDVPVGGETRIWAKRWSRSDERYREGHGYSAGVVDGTDPVDVTPVNGAALVFDARNYHRVLPCRAGTGRLTLSFFVGVTSDERLVIWS